MEDTINPRLLEAGADYNRVLVIDESIDCLCMTDERLVRDKLRKPFFLCRQRAQLERMKQLCKERKNLYQKQNDLKGQKQQIERALER